MRTERAGIDPSDGPAFEAPRPHPPDRFAHDPALGRVADRLETLGAGARGPHVALVQRALVDLGYRLSRDGVDGAWGTETTHALERFQRDFELAPTGRLDAETLATLARLAPPPGQSVERNPEWDRLTEDGRIDLTIAHGFYDEEEGRLLSWSTGRLVAGLFDLGFQPIDPDRMTEGDRDRLGLGPERYEPGASYFVRTVPSGPGGRPVDVVVAFVSPESADSPEGVRDQLVRALGRDEAVVYMGHARYGTGPDFDAIDSGRGNFVVDRTGGPLGHPHAPLSDSIAAAPRSMLPRVSAPPDGYQVLYFQACTTENYLPSLRDARIFPGRDRANTDVIGTTIPMRIATAPLHVLGFVSMLCEGRSVGAFVDEANERERAYIRSLLDAGIPPAQLDGVDEARARGALFESGFADNAANRVR